MSDDMNPEVEETPEAVDAAEPTEAPAAESVPTDEAFPSTDDDVVDDDVLNELISDEEPTEEPAEEPEIDTTSETGDRSAYEQILRRDNVPQEVIESLDPATAKVWAERAGKRQADVDQYANRLREMEERLQPAQQAEDGQPAVEAEPIPDALRDIIGDDAAETVQTMISERAAEATKQAVQQVTQQQQHRAVAQHVVSQIQTADHQTRTLYGDNAPSKEAVITEMSRLGRAHPKSFDSVGTMLTQAYKNLAGDPPVQRRPAKRQPSAPKSQPRRPAKTPENVEDAALDVLMSGGSQEDVQRRLRT